MDFLRIGVIRCIRNYGRKFYEIFDNPWNFIEIEKLGRSILQGIVGALFIKCNLYWCRFRKTSKLGQYPVTEVMVITLITAIISYPNPYTRLNMSQLILLLFSQCGISNSDLLW